MLNKCATDVFFFNSIILPFSAYFQFCRIFEMAISTKNSKFCYILGHFVKIQTISDFEKKEFRGKLTLYKNHSSILEIVIFYIFVNPKIKFLTFEKSTRPSFELLRFFEVKFCINQSLIKEKIVIYA